MKTKRGISPVIATTMLIGLVIVLGLVIAVWFSSFTQEAIVKFDKNIQLVCSEDVSLNVNTVGETLEVQNTGTTPVLNLKAIVEGDGFTETRDINELYTGWPSYGLEQAVTVSLEKIDTGETFNKITIVPVLMGISEEGRTEYECDEDNGYAVLL